MPTYSVLETDPRGYHSMRYVLNKGTGKPVTFTSRAAAIASAVRHARKKHTATRVVVSGGGMLGGGGMVWDSSGWRASDLRKE